jgi:hypothetical protein
VDLVGIEPPISSMPWKPYYILGCHSDLSRKKRIRKSVSAHCCNAFASEGCLRLAESNRQRLWSA